MTAERPFPPPAAEAAVTGLDALLADARTGPLRLLPGTSGLRATAALAGRPQAVVRRGAGLVAELARIGLGRSRVAPARDDARYADPAWETNPLLRRLAQAHLAASTAADALVTDAALAPDDDARVRAAVTGLAAALAPSSTPLHPDVWRRAMETGGASAVRGARRLLADVAAGSVPGTGGAAFEVGTDVAATAGAVVLRTPVVELVQYLPQTELVHDVPLLVVPPVLNRYYVADLAPGRSIVEHLVRAGVQVFALSWRNPLADHAHWDLDTYARALLDAMDAAEHIARVPRSSLMAFGAGATVTAMLLAHLAATGAQDRVAAVTLAGAVLGVRPAPAGAAAAVAASERAGHLDGRPLLAELAWRAPDALLWPRAVRAYLCGAEPATSEALSWLGDTTRVPAGLHRDLVDVATRASLAVPGAAGLLGTPLDLAKVDRDCYLVAGATDPVTPWRDAWAATGLFGGACRFVLATGGQVASLVSPPGEPDARYRAVEATHGDPGRRLAAAAEHPTSWWDDHVAWLTARSGPLHDAPPELGGRGLHALAPAPGAYVQQH
jgi:polyhydroxyalkanoate synthase subunit PhaC